MIPAEARNWSNKVSRPFCASEFSKIISGRLFGTHGACFPQFFLGWTGGIITVILSGSRKAVLAVFAVVSTGALVYAGALISANYSIVSGIVSAGGGAAVSPQYRIAAGALGQGAAGSAQSASYVNSSGFSGQAAPVAVPPASDLSDAYVYPNPFKPNTPGAFQSDKITFKKLPAQAKVKIFSIVGKQVAEFNKADATVDYYDWDVRNSHGEKLASGVYIFYVTAPGAGKARGKFAVIR
jgi:hypothetical protein